MFRANKNTQKQQKPKFEFSVGYLNCSNSRRIYRSCITIRRLESPCPYWWQHIDRFFVGLLKQSGWRFCEQFKESVRVATNGFNFFIGD